MEKEYHNISSRQSDVESQNRMSVDTDCDLDEDDSYMPPQGAEEEKKLLLRRERRKAKLHRKPAKQSDTKIAKALVVIIVPIVLLFATCIYISLHDAKSKNTMPAAAPTGSTFHSGFDMKQNWGSFSPYFDTGPSFPGVDQPAPESGLNGLSPQCSLKQVHILHRHAERFPTPGQGRNMQKVANKLNSMTKPPAKQFEWLDKWEYKLGVDLLVPTGTATEFTSGAHFWATHGRHLFNATAKGHLFYDPVLNVYENGTQRPIPVLRATTQSRIQTSARAWAAGFFGVYGDDPARSPNFESSDDVYKLVLQEEAPGRNNTLAGYFSCPNANNASYVTGNKRMLEWANIYMADAAVRLQKLLPGYENLTAVDAFYMQQICTHETAVYSTLSPFCSYFTEKEWRGFEYSHDLNFFGSASYGCAVGAAEGAGWLYELLGRLEHRLITVPQNGVNVTFTNSEDKFPLDQTIYLDMSHDSVIVSVLTALGLDFMNEHLSSTKILAPRQFIISRITPFGARLYVEVIDCEEDEELSVRLKLNNRVLPLSGLKYCAANKSGLCPYDKFIASIKYALDVVDFDETCYGVPKNWPTK